MRKKNGNFVIKKEKKKKRTPEGAAFAGKMAERNGCVKAKEKGEPPNNNKKKRRKDIENEYFKGKTKQKKRNQRIKWKRIDPSTVRTTAGRSKKTTTGKPSKTR